METYTRIESQFFHMQTNVHIRKSRLVADLADTTALVLRSVVGKGGSELAPCANLRSLPIEDVDGKHDKTGKTGKDRTSILNLELVANVLVHRRRIHSG